MSLLRSMNHVDLPCTENTPSLEALEARTLLSADWSGTWTFKGMLGEADTSWNRAWFDGGPIGTRVVITEQDGGYHVSVPQFRDAFDLDVVGDELHGFYAGPDEDNDYEETYYRAIPINDNAALFMMGNGGYEDAGMSDLWWSSGVAGLMTRGSVPFTKRPLAGEYQVHGYSVEAETGGWDWSGQVTMNADDFQVRLTSLGGGQYQGERIGDGGAPITFLARNGGLAHDNVDQNDQEREEEHVFVFPGPDDTLYLMEGGATYNADQTDLLYAWHFAGVLTPLPGFEYRPDLTATIDSSRLPAAATSGSGQKIQTAITIRNDGIAPCAPGAKIDIDIFARTDDGQGGFVDTLLTTLRNQNVSSLGPGKARPIKTLVTLPSGLATGSYTLVAQIDTGNAVAEGNELGTAEENEAVSDGVIEVTEGRPDLATAVDAVKLPATVRANKALRGVVSLLVNNEGNAPLPARQAFDVRVVARDGVGNEIDLAHLTNCIIRLTGAATKKINAAVNLRAGLPEGDYTVVAIVTPVTELLEWDVANNTAAWDGQLLAQA